MKTLFVLIVFGTLHSLSLALPYPHRYRVLRDIQNRPIVPIASGYSSSPQPHSCPSPLLSGGREFAECLEKQILDSMNFANDDPSTHGDLAGGSDGQGTNCRIDGPLAPGSGDPGTSNPAEEYPSPDPGNPVIPVNGPVYGNLVSEGPIPGAPVLPAAPLPAVPLLAPPLPAVPVPVAPALAAPVPAIPIPGDPLPAAPISAAPLPVAPLPRNLMVADSVPTIPVLGNVISI